jgi:hypothetical protein
MSSDSNLRRISTEISILSRIASALEKSSSSNMENQLLKLMVFAHRKDLTVEPTHRCSSGVKCVAIYFGKSTANSAVMKKAESLGLGEPTIGNSSSGSRIMYWENFPASPRLAGRWEIAFADEIDAEDRRRETSERGLDGFDGEGDAGWW